VVIIIIIIRIKLHVQPKLHVQTLLLPLPASSPRQRSTKEHVAMAQ
jgi:hypothetical protein